MKALTETDEKHHCIYIDINIQTSRNVNNKTTQNLRIIHRKTGVPLHTDYICFCFIFIGFWLHFNTLKIFYIGALLTISK